MTERRSQGRARGLFGTALSAGVLLAAGIAAASWLHRDLSTNDFERFDDLRLSYAFFALFTVAVAAYAGLVEEGSAPTRRQVMVGLLAFGLPLVTAFPVGSRDVFAYAFYPKMWAAYGVNPYLQPPSSVSQDPWFPMLQAWWKDHPTAYGPIFTLQARSVYALAGRSLAAVVATYKLINLPLLLLSGWLLVQLRRNITTEDEQPDDARALALWLWCPLVLFESLVSGHNDLAMVVLIQAAVLTWVRGSWLGCGALLAASFWYKLYSIVLLPLWFVWWLRRSGRRSTSQIALALAGAALVSVAVIAPFWGEIGAIVASLRGHEVARLIFPNEMPPPVWGLYQLLIATGRLDSDAGLRLFGLLRLGIFGSGLLWLVLRRRGEPYRPGLFVDDCFLSLALFVSFVPTVLYPWHVLALCPLALAVGGRGHERAVTLITAVGLLSYFLTFVWALLLCALVVGALWLLRRRR